MWQVWWPELAIGGEESHSWARHCERFLMDKDLIMLACTVLYFVVKEQVEAGSCRCLLKGKVEVSFYLNVLYHKNLKI